MRLKFKIVKNWVLITNCYDYINKLFIYYSIMKTYNSFFFIFLAVLSFVFFSTTTISIPTTGFVPYPPTPSDIDITELDPETVLCGNNICQSGENCSNCPSDCGSCVNQTQSNTNQSQQSGIQSGTGSGSSGGSGIVESPSVTQPIKKISNVDLLLEDLKSGKDKNLSLNLENGNAPLDALIELKISYKNKVVHSDILKLKNVLPNETTNASFKKLWKPASEGEYVALVTVYSTDKKIKYYSLEKRIDFNVSGTQVANDSNKLSGKKPIKPVIVSDDKNKQTQGEFKNQGQGIISIMDLLYPVVILGIIILLVVGVWKFFPNLFKS
jgi:hypothetical protein